MSRKAIITIIVAAFLALNIACVYAADDNSGGAVLDISTTGFEGDAEIYVNNMKSGEHTIAGLKLEEGGYRISVYPGAIYQTLEYSMAVKNGKHYNVHFNLAPGSKGNSMHWPTFLIAGGVAWGVCLVGWFVTR
ncbi:MAG: hypothetical protein GY771_10390 [bacterium]|nr:hypothetical protein [bacterium]